LICGKFTSGLVAALEITKMGESASRQTVNCSSLTEADSSVERSEAHPLFGAESTFVIHLCGRVNHPIKD